MSASVHWRVLITGGAGYIGSVLADRMIRMGHSVRCFDNLTYGGEAVLHLLQQPSFELHVADIRDTEEVQRALADIEAVIHLAAVVGDPACRKQPQLATEVNGEASEQLLQLSLEADVRRFVFASTCSNYGRMAEADGWVDEDSPLNPVSHYARLKVAFEQRLMELEGSQLCPVCLRFATAFGLSSRPRFDLTVNEFTRDLALGRNIEIYGEQFWRPYCHVNDIVRACIKAIEASPEEIDLKAFNVGDNSQNYRKRDLVEMIIRQIPSAADLVSYVHREEDPRDYRVRFNRIKEVLGFKVTQTVADGIAEIKEAVASGLISDSDDPRYRNL